MCLLDWPWSGWTARRPAVVPAHWIDHLPSDQLAAIGYTAEDPQGLDVDVFTRPWWARVFG